MEFQKIIHVILVVDFGGVAQLGERVVRNDEVRGSIPLTSTKFLHTPGGCARSVAQKNPTIHVVGFLLPSEA